MDLIGVAVSGMNNAHDISADMEQGKKQQQRGKLQRLLREQKARLYIIRRCVVMLLCWSD
ncbi:hypothetical protein C2845_PM03G31160 [Panicum miliaceum]|uniref:Uncharacterized protein n=1 Tax=Panicum miliaceum TaxID=4540 RepID=A0A3L6TFG6_PANMI|nr:hypothetical protein C2845_PM03G31160 [Panicum miliaceum]